MVDGVGNAGVLGNALVSEVDVALGIQGNVLKQSVALDGVVDIRLGFFVQVDDLSIAAALEVKDAVVVPAVLIVADQQALRVGGQGGLAGAGQAEEDGGVLAVQVGVGRAVHGSHALQRQVVVHHGEHTLLHLAAVPGVDDDLLTAGNVEGNAGLAVQAQFLIVLDLGLGSVVDDEVRLEVGELFLGRADEHVGDEVRLPCDLDDEADGHAGIMVRAAERVDDVQLLVAKLLDRDILDGRPGGLGHGVVVVLVLVGGPPHGVLGVRVHDDILVFGGAAGVDAGHDVDRAQLADPTDFVPFKTSLGLFREQRLVGGVADDFSRTGDPVLFQIQFSH